MGTAAGTAIFVKFGWRPAAALSVGFTGLSMLIMFARGPHVKRYTWVGWEGGWEMRKQKFEDTKGEKRGLEDATPAAADIEDGKGAEAEGESSNRVHGNTQ